MFDLSVLSGLLQVAFRLSLLHFFLPRISSVCWYKTYQYIWWLLSAEVIMPSFFATYFTVNLFFYYSFQTFLLCLFVWNPILSYFVRILCFNYHLSATSILSNFFFSVYFFSFIQTASVVFFPDDTIPPSLFFAILSPFASSISFCPFSCMPFCRILYFVLGASAKLRKATISFLISVLYVHMEQLGFHWTHFMKFGMWLFFDNRSRKFKFH